MLNSLKRAVVPSPFSISHFKVSDQTKEYLIKRNRPMIFSHDQLKRGLELGIVFEQLIKMTNLHIMVVNSMLLAPQWHWLDSRNWEFLKFLKRANVVEFQRLSVLSQNIIYRLEILTENFAEMAFLYLIKNVSSSKNRFSSPWFSAHVFVEWFLTNLAPGLLYKRKEKRRPYFLFTLIKKSWGKVFWSWLWCGVSK